MNRKGTRSFLGRLDAFATPYTWHMLMNNPVLQEIYDTGEVLDGGGAKRPLAGHVSKVSGEAMYQVVREANPAVCVEIGLAYGLSALPILSALQDNDAGRLYSVDPYQSEQWGNTAVANIGRAGLSERFQLREEPDFLALPTLLAELGRSVGFAFIDGWHTVDYVLLDAFYVDKMLQPGGVVAFDDTGMAAVRKVIGYLTSHRHYKEIDVGLPTAYTSSNVAKTAVRGVMRWKTQNRYFRKLDNFEPDWNFFARF